MSRGRSRRWHCHTQTGERLDLSSTAPLAGHTLSFIRSVERGDKCEALTVRDNRLLRLEFLLVSSFQDDALDASFRKVIVPEVDDESQRLVHCRSASGH